MIFEYTKLKIFFSEIKKLGGFQVFREWRGDKVFLLRHDVDFDLQLAHKLALIEKKEDIASTFFILLSCGSYNVMAKKNRRLLEDIDKLGHEIGLHFDPSIYKGDLDKYVEQEIYILSNIIQKEVKSISLHNPSVTGKFPIFNGYINAYDPKLFSDDNYISDSQFLFRGKNPFKFLKNIEKHMIQILLHPMHYSETGDGYDQIMVDNIIRYINDLHNNFKINSTYNKQIGDNLLRILKKSIIV